MTLYEDTRTCCWCCYYYYYYYYYYYCYCYCYYYYYYYYSYYYYYYYYYSYYYYYYSYSYSYCYCYYSYSYYSYSYCYCYSYYYYYTTLHYTTLHYATAVSASLPHPARLSPPAGWLVNSILDFRVCCLVSIAVGLYCSWFIRYYFYPMLRFRRAAVIRKTTSERLSICRCLSGLVS